MRYFQSKYSNDIIKKGHSGFNENCVQRIVLAQVSSVCPFVHKSRDFEGRRPYSRQGSGEPKRFKALASQTREQTPCTQRYPRITHTCLVLSQSLHRHTRVAILLLLWQIKVCILKCADDDMLISKVQTWLPAKNRDIQPGFMCGGNVLLDKYMQ